MFLKLQEQLQTHFNDIVAQSPVQFKTKNVNFKKKEGKDPMKESFKKKQQNKRV